MNAAPRWLRVNENPLENVDRSAGWRYLIIESDTAGEFGPGRLCLGFAFSVCSSFSKFRPTGPRKQFASSIESAGEPK